MIEVMQGGLRFRWDWGEYELRVLQGGCQVTTLTVGTPPTLATLDDVHDVIDGFCEERRR